jgi:hypothetical protein
MMKYSNIEISVRTLIVSITLLFSLFPLLNFGQANQPIDSIKSISKLQSDSVFFDFKEFALYSKTQNFNDRFKTIKQCRVAYTCRKKSGSFLIHNNYLPKSFLEKIRKLRVTKIELKFSNIILNSDQDNSSERNCPDFTYIIHKKPCFKLGVGAWWIPCPIPSYPIKNKD